MIELTVASDGESRVLNAPENGNLLKVLQDAGYDLYSPCGGNGTCGKCKVWLKGEGSVSTCVYHVTRPLEILLPGRKEARILVEQHRHTRKVPLMPGPAANLSVYPHGVAIDLGTTSLVFYLINLVTGTLVETRAMLNPQSRYGGDVISRINHTAEEDKGLQELQRLIISAINEQLDHFADFAGISRNEIVILSVAGNTTMLHLLLAENPLSIALAPFTPLFTEARTLKGSDLGLHCNPEGELRVLPSISGYVGADIVAGLSSIMPSDATRNYLFLDIGTNGELALGTPDGILCCSTAAGPAFEGARISCGMGGVEGAISEYSASGLKVIGDTDPAGICGSGLIDIVASMIEEGILAEDGLLEKNFSVAGSGRTASGTEISITQQDIREVQLAKSAIAAGVNVLLQEGGLDPADVDAVYLAGGFGNYINPESAMKIGLISPAFKGKIVPLGNTSGLGALLSVKSFPFNETMEEIRAGTRYIELSGHDGFSLEFAMNMNF